MDEIEDIEVIEDVAEVREGSEFDLTPVTTPSTSDRPNSLSCPGETGKSDASFGFGHENVRMSVSDSGVQGGHGGKGGSPLTGKDEGGSSSQTVSGSDSRPGA